MLEDWRIHDETRYLNWLGKNTTHQNPCLCISVGAWRSPLLTAFGVCVPAQLGGEQTSHFGCLREITPKIGYLTKSLTWSIYFVGNQCKYQVTAHIPGFVSEKNYALEKCLACSG